MSRVGFAVMLALVVFHVSLGYGQDSQHRAAVLLVVHKQSPLVDAEPPTKVRSGTMLIGIRREDFGKPARPGWRVATLDGRPRKGWVFVGAVTTFHARARELKATAISLRASRQKTGKTTTLPELILLQNKPAIRRAWKEVTEAIAENEALPEKERLPEPYFARAEIWASVENYSDSLRDYLTAIKYARRANRNLLSYSVYFDKLYDVAGKLRNMPVPARGAERKTARSARKHFGHGYSKYFRGELTEALTHFDSAVQLAPDQPSYWYFRALIHRRLRDDQRAQHDALMGAYFERQLTPHRRRMLNRCFSRVQGKTRTWLESFRQGAPIPNRLGVHNVRLDAAGRSR